MRGSAFALGLLTVGGALLGVAGVSATLQQTVAVPPTLFPMLAIGGTALCAAGLAVLMVVHIGLMLDVRKGMKRVTRFLDRFESTGDLLCREVATEELHDLREFVTEVLGTDDVTPLETMRAMCDKNPEVLSVVIRKPGTDGAGGEGQPVAIRGYFCIFPLTRAATRLVQSEILTGNKIGPEQLVKARSRPASIYIGGVAGRGQSRRSGFVLAHLQAKLSTAARRGTPIYARPVTRDGLRLMRHFNFKPLRPAHGSDEGLGRIHVWCPRAGFRMADGR